MKKTLKKFIKQWDLQLLAIPAVIWLIIFAYIPMSGLQIAFKDFSMRRGIWGSEWIGFDYFIEMATDPFMRRAIINTVGLSLIRLLILFPAPIIFALMLNELKNGFFKKTVQTVSYFPYFISWTIVAVMAQQWLSMDTGFVNDFLMKIGLLKEPYSFLTRPEAFWPMVIGLEFWKGLGYNAIIYLAAISGIDQEQYEAAQLDGATKLQKILYITLPSIKGTVMTMFILNIGGMIGGNFDVSYLLGNPTNAVRSDILQTYTFMIGIDNGRFDYGTAVGLASGIISMLLLFGSNKIVDKITGEGVF